MKRKWYEQVDKNSQPDSCMDSDSQWLIMAYTTASKKVVPAVISMNDDAKHNNLHPAI